MRRFPHIGALTAAVLAASWVVATPALAQRQSTPPATPQQQPQLSEQKIGAAAAAIQQVATVRQDYQQKIESAPPAEKPRLATEARDAMTKAVTDQGLSIEEYTEILVVAQKDTSVREKILQKLRGPSVQ